MWFNLPRCDKYFDKLLLCLRLLRGHSGQHPLKIIDLTRIIKLKD